MTPEERAKLTVEDWEEGATAGHPSHGWSIHTLPAVVAKHIRDAENDVLERAALAIEATVGAEDEDEEASVTGMAEFHCWTIRNLKHPTPG